jgi:poly(3-hydroxybutyrate) depolymerase
VIGSQALPFYQFYEWQHAALSPYRVAADATRLLFRNPVNPLAHTVVGRTMVAAAEMFERSTRRYGKPEFGIPSVLVGGERVAITERVVWQRPFCNLIRFEKGPVSSKRTFPKVLLVAPMSGHYATLLRGTVEAFLPRHDVYITDWADARMVPLTAGTFGLDDYIDYVISMLHALGGDTHVVAVCQPAVPVLAAVSVMEAREDPFAPITMTLMGGPIDTRISPTAVNDLASSKGIDWFRDKVILTVPFPHPGFMRKVYPGFLQITGFMTMNLDRHVDAHRQLFQHLVSGDGDSARKHKDFYDEYLAVMDLDAAFYLQTVETVFIRHALPKGEMMHHGERVDPGKIRTVAMMTVEGEKDDITGGGQTEAAHRLTTSLPEDMRVHYLQPSVGHYGVFNGSRFRAEIQPRIADFIATHQQRRDKARRTPKAANVNANATEKASSTGKSLLARIARTRS